MQAKYISKILSRRDVSVINNGNKCLTIISYINFINWLGSKDFQVESVISEIKFRVNQLQSIIVC